MEKITSLRAALVAPNPEFATAPDRLKIFVDAGRVVSRYGPKLSYQYRYTVRLFVEGYTRGADILMVPLLLWLRVHQPDLLLNFTREDEAIKFAADILDDGSADIAITFELSEAVTLQARPDGSGWDVTHMPEPSPEDPPLIPELRREDGSIVELEQLYLGGVKILPRE